jgi:hypothetical protein
MATSLSRKLSNVPTLNIPGQGFQSNSAKAPGAFRLNCPICHQTSPTDIESFPSASFVPEVVDLSFCLGLEHQTCIQPYHNSCPG